MKAGWQIERPRSVFLATSIIEPHGQTYNWLKPGSDSEHSGSGSMLGETSSRGLTWLPVSMQLSGAPVAVFQNRMQRSAVPPPLASRPCW